MNMKIIKWIRIGGNIEISLEIEIVGTKSNSSEEDKYERKYFYIFSSNKEYYM